MRYRGLWNLDELYDLDVVLTENDNLLARPGHGALAERSSGRLFDLLERTGEMAIPLSRDENYRFDRRDPNGPPQARSRSGSLTCITTRARSGRLQRL